MLPPGLFLKGYEYKIGIVYQQYPQLALSPHYLNGMHTAPRLTYGKLKCGKDMVWHVALEHILIVYGVITNYDYELFFVLWFCAV